MPKLSTYDPLTSRPSDADIVPITSGNATRNVPVSVLIRQPFLTIGQTGMSADILCTGTNDDVTIQAAINAAGTGRRIVFRSSTTPYRLSAKLLLPSKSEIEGESRDGVVLQMDAGANTTILGNSNTTSGNSFIRLKNLTLDQQGASQTAGGAMSFTGLTDSVFDNIYVKTTVSFNLFVGTVSGTTLTGTATFTNGSETVVGSGTSFLSEVSAYSILKTPAGQFARVLSVTDNTHLMLDRQWGWTTESAVSFKLVPANSRNKILNCEFGGNTAFLTGDDNVGLGLFDHSLIQGCISHDSHGYGFGPDHCNYIKFIGNTVYNNPSSGFGLETMGYGEIVGNHSYANGVGINLLSGAYRTLVANNECYDNTSKGISASYNTATYPQASENSIVGNIVSATTGATGDGIYIAGVDKTLVVNNRCFNNARGGIVTSSGASSVNATNTLIQGNICYDTKSTKTQQYGIWVSANSTNTYVMNNVSKDGDNLTNGILNSGTSTTLTSNITT